MMPTIIIIMQIIMMIILKEQYLLNVYIIINLIK